MNATGSVVVGTDLGPAADEAVRQAHQYCIERQSRLVVCHVIPSPLRMNVLFPQLNMEATRHGFEPLRIAGLVERRVRQLTKRSRGEFDVIVEDGTPDEALVRCAEKHHAELVVVGGSSDGAVGSFLGGVAERVVRYANGPVLVARPARPTGRVLIATDFSNASLPALAAAVIETKRRHAQLHIVHCLYFGSGNTTSIYPTVVGPSSLPIDDGSIAELHRQAKRRMESVLRRFSAIAELHVVRGEPASAILALSDELRAELLVVGTRGRTGLSRLVLGSVAEFVVRHAKQPTLVVRLAPFNPRARWLRSTEDGPAGTAASSAQSRRA